MVWKDAKCSWCSKEGQYYSPTTQEFFCSDLYCDRNKHKKQWEYNRYNKISEDATSGVINFK